tara:strand:- start:384 stop:563 length:180 start_codon:yes stop_codon:yes gene_type:complete
MNLEEQRKYELSENQKWLHTLISQQSEELQILKNDNSEMREICKALTSRIRILENKGVK